MTTEHKPHSRQDVAIIRRALLREGPAMSALANLEQQFQRLEGQLERHERALQYAVDHAESLGYTYSAMWLRELQEVTRGERSWEDAGVVASV